MAELIGGAAAVLTLNSVDLSDHMTSASLDIEYDSVTTTSFGDTVETLIAGIGRGTLNVTFNQDYAASEVDATAVLSKPFDLDDLRLILGALVNGGNRLPA